MTPLSRSTGEGQGVRAECDRANPRKFPEIRHLPDIRPLQTINEGATMKIVFPLISAIVCTCLSAPDASGADTGKPFKQDAVLYRNAEQYSAFPSLRQDGDRLWVGFNWNTIRSHYGLAAGGKMGHVALYSPDGGHTWLDHQSKEYSPPPADTSYLVLRDGTRISIAAIMHEVLPGDKKAELQAKGVLVKDWPDGHISASYRVRMSRQLPGQTKAKTSYPQPSPFASMGGFGFGVVTSDDVVLKPVYGRRLPTDTATSAWVLRSTDRGETWQLVDMASGRQPPFQRGRPAGVSRWPRVGNSTCRVGTEVRAASRDRFPLAVRVARFG